MFFVSRYDIDFKAVARHQSATCIVYVGVDRGDDNRQIVIKFMSHRHQFEREISSRAEGKFDKRFVVGILASYNGGDLDADPAVKTEFQRKGLGSFPFCLVMAAGDRSLHDILSSGTFICACFHFTWPLNQIF